MTNLQQQSSGGAILVLLRLSIFHEILESIFKWMLTRNLCQLPLKETPLGGIMRQIEGVLVGLSGHF